MPPQIFLLVPKIVSFPAPTPLHPHHPLQWLCTAGRAGCSCTTRGPNSTADAGCWGLAGGKAASLHARYMTARGNFPVQVARTPGHGWSEGGSGGTQDGEAGRGRSLGMQVEDAGQRAGLAARLLTCPCCRGRAGSLPARCLSFSSARRGVTGGVPAPCFGETNKSEKYPLSPVLMQPPPPLPCKGVQLPACLSPRTLSLTLSRELRIPFGYPTAPFHGLGATFHPLGAPGRKGPCR